MEMNVHDLLKINSKNDLISYELEIPDWVQVSIKRAPYVVLRRALTEGNYIPVGVRGTKRRERYAAFVNKKNIIDVYTPEQITRERSWLRYDQNIFTYLEDIKQLMYDKDIQWGPTGSVGFELVSNVPAVNKESDIDIIIRYTPRLTCSLSREILDYLNKLPVPIDVQVEMEEGAFSLQEYAYSEGKPILFKTKNGPLLKRVNSHEGIK